MNLNSLNGFSTDNLQSTLASQLTSNTLAGSSTQASKNGQTPSAFAQLLNDAANGQAQAASAAKASKTNPWLSTLMSLI